MKIFAPDYYRDFKCIAGECMHSCCVGWEIDIDEETLEYYSKLSGKLGEKLRENIDFEAGCFRLSEGDRCPFLNEKGLCEIILDKGEKGLCQICHDHPRFRSFFSGREEVGLGLCCEAAAKLMLDKESKTELVLIAEDGQGEDLCEEETEVLGLRDKALACIQNREQSLEHRIEEMLQIYGGALPKRSETEWAEFFFGLERLDENWTAVLKNIKDGDFLNEVPENSAEQLLCYFIFRHLSTALDDGLFAERAAFTVISYFMVIAAAKQVGIYEAARLYSGEIEYSDENISAVLEELSTPIGEII